MPCFHPLTRISNGSINLDTGKPMGTVVPYVPMNKRVPNTIYQDIPCGQCIGCRLDYSRKWADRLMLEAKNHKFTWFVTLTYDDNHIPLNPVSDPNSGELLRFNPTLKKRDVQLFMKRLRKAVEPQKIRFYCSGEYGDKTFRPHYHLIIFGLELNDLTFYKLSENKDCYYNSKTLDNAWNNKGYVVVTPATYETMLYTSRYVTKKLKGFEGSFYKSHNIAPPFSLMSRRPGIAGDNFNLDIMTFETISLPQGRKASHPRYFQKLLERDYPDFYDDYKIDRKMRSDARMQILLDSIEVPYLDYLKTCEFNLKNRIKILDEVKKI